jgi:hypothetical protein
MRRPRRGRTAVAAQGQLLKETLMVKRQYILSVIAVALLAAAPLSFAAPFGTFGTFGATPGQAFGTGPRPFMFGSAPERDTSSVIGSVGSTIPGSSVIGSVGSTIPGSSMIGSVGSQVPGSSSIGSVGSMPGFSLTNPGAIGTSPTCLPGLAANPC